MQEGISFDEALDRSGGRRRYQARAIASMSLNLMQVVAVLSSIPLFLTTPDLKCRSDTSTSLEPCTESELCSSGKSYIFDWKANRSIVYEWHLICEDSIYTYVIPIAFACCLGLSSLLFAFVGERQGRLYVLKVSSILTNCSVFILFCSASVWFFTLFFSLLGLCMGGIIVEPLVYMTELSEAKNRRTHFAIMTGVAMLGAVISPMAFSIFGNWRASIVSILAVGIIALGATTKFLVESPRFWAFNLSRYSKAKKAFDYISQINQADCIDTYLQGEMINEYNENNNNNQPDLSIRNLPGDYMGSAINVQDREENIERGQKCSFSDLVRVDSLRWTTVGLVNVCVALSFAIFIIKRDPEVLLGEYFDMVLYAIAETVGIICSYLLGRFLSLKKLLLASLLICACQSALSEYFDLHLASLFASGFSVYAFFSYVQEASPTPVRNLQSGVMVLCACFGYIAGETLLYYDFSMLRLIAGGLLFLSCADFFFIPEEDIRDTIEEESTLNNIIKDLKNSRDVTINRSHMVICDDSYYH